MLKDPVEFLDHILESINLIEDYIGGLKQETFLRVYQLQDSVIRRLEIIGEAARNLPEEFLQVWPDVPWRDIIDFRNVLIHGYFDIDLVQVWITATEELPVLKEKIVNIKKSLTANVG